MQVREAIQALQTYNPDEEIFITWFDFESENGELTRPQWKKVVIKLEKDDYLLDEVIAQIDNYSIQVRNEDATT